MTAVEIINVLLGLTQLISAGVDVEAKIAQVVTKAQTEGRDVTVADLASLVGDRKAAMEKLKDDLAK